MRQGTLLPQRRPRGSVRAVSEHQGRIAQILRESLRDVGRHLGRDVEQKLARDLHAALHPVVETVEQLDALPVRSLVRDDHGEVFERLRSGWDCLHEDGAGGLLKSTAIRLPARVLYTPEVNRG